MPDSTHWIFLPEDPREPPTEISTEELLGDFENFKDRCVLVPGRVWLGFKEQRERMRVLRSELELYNRPELTVVARRPSAQPAAKSVDASADPTGSAGETT